MVTFTDKISGIAVARDPQGTNRVAVLHGDGSNAYLGILSSDYTSKTDITLTGTMPTSPYNVIDSKPMLGGGTLIGISNTTEVGASNQQLILWNGANKATYTTGTITTAYNSKTVTGSGTAWLANLTPGMYLFDSTGFLIGMIVSVDSDTQVTLQESAYAAVSGASYSVKSIRGWMPRVVSGFITTSTSTTAVTGANTRFVDEGLSNGWRLFREEDGTYIGAVSTVTNNTGLTLGANATVAMANEGYFALNPNADFAASITTSTISKPGFLNAVYANRQFYANRSIAADAGGDFVNRLWFSDESDPEAVDMSKVDGSFIPITSGKNINSPINAIIPAYNSLLILKEREAFALFGQNTNQFEVRKLIDDGAISGMSAVPYQNGVLWAGREGIYYYDGITAENIVAKNLGSYYKEAIASFDSHTYRMWGFVHREHYFLHIERVTPPEAVIKGTTSTTPSEFTIVIYLPRRAVTFFTNFNIRGGVLLPSATAQNAWVVANSTVGKVCNLDAIFDEQGNDEFACDGGTAGPDFYIESRKFDAGDGLLKKFWKQIMVHYLVGGDSLRLDTVKGLNFVGQQSATSLPITVYTWDQIAALYPTWDSLASAFPTWDSLVTSIYFVKRIKFIKRDQYFAFRIYQNSSSVTSAKLGPYAIEFKPMRVGRI